MNEAKRTKIITFRVTEDEYKKIEDAAIARGTDPNDWCRQAIVGLSCKLINIPETMIYSEIACLRFLFEFGFRLLFAEGSDELAEWDELREGAEKNAKDLVATLLAKRKLGSR